MYKLDISLIKWLKNSIDSTKDQIKDLESVSEDFSLLAKEYKQRNNELMAERYRKSSELHIQDVKAYEVKLRERGEIAKKSAKEKEQSG